MQTSGGIALGYASAAIIAALLDHLIARNVISATDVKTILTDADAALDTLGNIVSAPGAHQVIGDVRSQLAKHGVR